MSEKETAANAAHEEKNPHVKVESKFGREDSINKWWILKQLFKVISAVYSPYTVPLLAWSLYKDVKTGKHREKRRFKLSDTKSLWDDLISFL